jgi:hypothetical protein
MFSVEGAIPFSHFYICLSKESKKEGTLGIQVSYRNVILHPLSSFPLLFIFPLASHIVRITMTDDDARQIGRIFKPL